MKGLPTQPALQDELGQDEWIFDELLAQQDEEPDEYTMDISELLDRDDDRRP